MTRIAWRGSGARPRCSRRSIIRTSRRSTAWRSTTASRALVLELVDGSTLEERIARGPLPADDALAIARQVADGLEAAHAAGVLHRDLKPANVKVRTDGTVKVLDFGLATALRPRARAAPHDVTTVETQTQAGILAGTPAYMSPEQVRGSEVDRRSDVWAFGTVVFEMLTGRKAFEGDGLQGTLAAVLESEPDWGRLPTDTPPAVLSVLRRCLAKDLRERLRDVGDASLGLRGAFEVPGVAAAEGASTGRAIGRTRRVAKLAGVVVLVSLAGAGVWTMRPALPAPPPPVQFTIPAPPRTGPFLQLSPDGRRLAFLAGDEAGRPRLWLHSFATGTARPVRGAGSVTTPMFWSPDSRSIAFARSGVLSRVKVASGVVDAVSDAAVLHGGSWNGDDVIVYGSRKGIVQVPAEGGLTVPVTTVDGARGEIVHAAPWFLPDDRHFLYLRVASDTSIGGIYIGTLGLEPSAQSPVRLVPTEMAAAYAPPSDPGATGHLVFMQGRRLLAQPFDHASLELAGDPVAVEEAVAGYEVWGAFSVSRGRIAWRAAGADGSVVWIEPSGGEAATEAIRGLEDPRYPRLSPDGRRLALVVGGDLWVFDLGGRPPIKVTFDVVGEGAPLWTPDGSRIVFEGDGSLHWVSADGGTPPEPIGPRGHFHAQAWSPSGDVIAIALSREGSRLVELSPMSDAAPRVVVEAPAGAAVTGAALSPDGRWLAYVSDATGQEEIWVRPYTKPGVPRRLSPGGGTEPVWARDGGSLFFLDGRTMMAVTVEAKANVEFEAPVALFDSDHRAYQQPPSYDVAADGRFVTIRSEEAPMSVVVNWPDPQRSVSGESAPPP